MTIVKLSRREMLAVLRAPTRRGIIAELADKYCCSESLIRHVRYKCKWMLKESK